MRISDWSSDVCSSDLRRLSSAQGRHAFCRLSVLWNVFEQWQQTLFVLKEISILDPRTIVGVRGPVGLRSEEHTSELQSLMRNSYAVFCLKKKKIKRNSDNTDSLSDIHLHRSKFN